MNASRAATRYDGGVTSHSTILGLIPARGGSKRLPGKNVVLFRGKPLISHTVEAAIASGVLDRIVVTTDAQDIADAALKSGAEVPFLRPAVLAADATTTEDVMLHAIGWLQHEQGYEPAFVLLLQPTSPLRTADDIRACVRLAEQKNADAVVSVCKEQRPTRAVIPQADGTVVALADAKTTSDDAHYVNGALYLIRTKTFLGQGTLYPPRTVMYVMPEERSADIDTAEDLRQAESA